MTVSQMLRSMTSADLAEQMAFDMLKDDEMRGEAEKSLQRDRMKDMTPAEKTAYLRGAFSNMRSE